MMKLGIWALLFVGVACSSGGNKSQPSETQSQPATAAETSAKSTTTATTDPVSTDPPEQGKDAGESLVGEVSDLSGLVSDLKGKETSAEILINLSADVLFDFDKADIKPAAYSDLRKLVQLINEKGKGPVQITGHTDAKGDDTYNQDLSVRRAESVKNWLSNNGLVKPDAIVTAGKGESQPVASNQKSDGSDDPDGRQKNRRVEIVIRKTT
ncbi:OmpA family protein [Spirosoma sp. BT702]|uniref:OmpA family protein n=1 Tax=Spirosoma profusum TaxID=2771354 RepID=A0A927AQ27_9BACT|nr:OmpA family protein [Spirosoma profusum]MBD2699553.1 OmpA family protein [Spirosoma profusum]